MNNIHGDLSLLDLGVHMLEIWRKIASLETDVFAQRYALIVVVHATIGYKKLGYRRVTARCVLSVVILPITTQQCRNYLYYKS